MRRTIVILSLILTCGGFVSCSRQDTVASQAEVNQNQGTGQAESQKPPIAAPLLKDRDWTILTRSDLIKDSFGDAFEGVWQPSESDVVRAVQEVRSYLENLKKTTPSKDERARIEVILSKSGDYYGCQAYGCTMDGEKLIYLNFVSKSTLKEMWLDWRHHMIDGTESGADSWYVFYDHKTKAFSGFDTYRSDGDSDNIDSGGNSPAKEHKHGHA